MIYKGVNINIRKLLHHPIKYSKWIKEEIEYETNKGNIIKSQNLDFSKFYPKETKKMVLFIVPGNIKINGGVMSICAIAKTSKELLEKKGYSVALVTIPQDKIFYEYTEFDSEFKVFRLEQILELQNIKEMILHIPETYIKKFLEILKEKEIEYFKRIPNLQLNILNQNIELMPKEEYTDKLKKICKNITMTTAHKKYCTKELMEKYKIPVHMLLASYLANYVYRDFEEKENIIIYSPDNIKLYKRKIISKLKKELTGFKIIEIKNIKYKKYLELTSKAKFSISFGEGLDGYFSENIRCGGIGFAVYNEEFFDKKYKNLPVLYNSYKEMYFNIVNDIKKYLENKDDYKDVSRNIRNIIDKDYPLEDYVNNIKKFYEKDYTFKL